MFTPYPSINHQYCRPYCVNLNVHRKFLRFNGKFTVTDSNGNAIFTVDSALMTLHSRHVLRDVAGHSIFTLHKKIMTMHDRWEVFRGESTESNNLLFSVKRISMIQWKIQLDVFLAYNKSEDVWDFMVDVDWFKRSFVVYARQPSIILAKMENKVVTVYPNVDYAFIAALIVILDNMKMVDPITRLTLHQMTGDFGVSDFLLDAMASFWG